MNQQAKYIDQRSFSFESYCPNTQTHTADQLRYSVTKAVRNEDACMKLVH